MTGSTRVLTRCIKLEIWCRTHARCVVLPLARKSVTSTLVVALGPLGEFASLLSNVDKARPAFKDTKWTAPIVPLHLPGAFEEAGRAFALNLASPYVPLDRAQSLRSQDQAEADDQCRHDSFYTNIYGKRGSGVL